LGGAIATDTPDHAEGLEVEPDDDDDEVVSIAEEPEEAL
jgi:hypothetical protein